MKPLPLAWKPVLLAPVVPPKPLGKPHAAAIAAAARIAEAQRDQEATEAEQVAENTTFEVHGLGEAETTRLPTAEEQRLLREVIDDPSFVLNGTLSVRLFIGAGMPTGLWRRVSEVFAPAHVVEFFATTDGQAVLANVSGAKVGSKGRLLPGAGRIELGAYDTEHDLILENERGFVQIAEPKQVGVLLAASNGPIGAVRYVDVRQSMRNGGGPACLRLRVVLTEPELAATNPAMRLTDALHADLSTWANRWYRDELRPADLADPALLDESRGALDELTTILKLGAGFYPFQRA